MPRRFGLSGHKAPPTFDPCQKLDLTGRSEAGYISLFEHQPPLALLPPVKWFGCFRQISTPARRRALRFRLRRSVTQPYPWHRAWLVC
jgi:hypothetical protein